MNGGQDVVYRGAAAVIAGASLFGGRGLIAGALSGGLIVAAVIASRLLLLSLLLLSLLMATRVPALAAFAAEQEPMPDLSR